MKPLKWKKGELNICTPSLGCKVVKGYKYGELGVHRIPELGGIKHGAKDPAWSITHLTTGCGISAINQPPFKTLADAKEFASRLMQSDTWYIEGAEFGNTDRVKPGRILALVKVLKTLLIEDGYASSLVGNEQGIRETVLHMCDCGKIAERYILAIGNKWKHRCLECEPHTKGV